jgi:hypothetical protein
VENCGIFEVIGIHSGTDHVRELNYGLLLGRILKNQDMKENAEIKIKEFS